MTENNASFDYEEKGEKYPSYRRTDPRIAKFIHNELGNAKTVLNVGAGAGSYEPNDRYVVAVEPSMIMRSHRLAQQKVPAIIGTAQSIPFDENSFDVSMAILTLHHWSDWKKGLQEMKRVTKNKILILTFDAELLGNSWTSYYFPEIFEVEKKRYPTIESIIEELGYKCTVQTIPVPFNCTDGFREAYFGRPEELLKKEVRQVQSAWGFLEPGIEDMKVKILENELKSGEWDKKFGKFRSMSEFENALKLITAIPE